jgi:hypothetical protein
MKTNDIFEQEVLPHTDSSARKIAQQLVRTAKRNAASDGYGVEVLAKKLAARYYKSILDEIEFELKMQQARRV